MKDPLIEIGSIIKSAREQAGMSIDELALESRVSIHHIKNLESANRAELPEETYLTGFLTKVLKALKIENANKLISKFKDKEGDYILQSLVNNNDPELEAKAESKSYFKIYHIYILLGIIFLAIAWFVISSANTDNEESPGKKLKVEQKINKTKKIAEEENTVKTVSPKDKEEELEDWENLEKPQREYRYNNLEIRGRGDKSLYIKVKEVAWVQVIGIEDRKILFEGDVFPSREPNYFRFRDDDGFVIATGNAGAFEIDAGEGPFMLGASGQLIKWYYPKSARRKFERSTKKTTRYQEQQLLY